MSATDRVTWTVTAWGSWTEVEAGRRAHHSRHDTAAEARAVYDALPYPIADLIRHDPALDGLATGDTILRDVMPWTVDRTPVHANGAARN